jgi:hypothetical protein
MSATIARLLLAVIALFAVPIVYFIVLVIAIESRLFGGRHGDATGLVIATIVSAIYLIAAWVAVWRGTVRWTRLRTGLTVAVTFAAAIAALVVVLLISETIREEEVAIVIGAMGWAVLWLGAVTLVWRETHAERAARLRAMGTDAIACPHCGYNLTGLKSTQCPECGTQYTTDQLVAAAVRRDELETG